MADRRPVDDHRKDAFAALGSHAHDQVPGRSAGLRLATSINAGSP
jgi:hypothetical protein